MVFVLLLLAAFTGKSQDTLRVMFWVEDLTKIDTGFYYVQFEDGSTDSVRVSNDWVTALPGYIIGDGEMVDCWFKPIDPKLKIWSWEERTLRPKPTEEPLGNKEFWYRGKSYD